MSSLHRDSTDSLIDSIYRQFPFSPQPASSMPQMKLTPLQKKRKKKQLGTLVCQYAAPLINTKTTTQICTKPYITYLSYLQKKQANSYLQTEDPKLNRTLPPHGSGSLVHMAPDVRLRSLDFLLDPILIRQQWVLAPHETYTIKEILLQPARDANPNE